MAQPQAQSAGVISACVVLAGGLKASPLQALCEVSVLDLSLRHGASVLGDVLARVAEAVGQPGGRVPVRVVYGPPVPAPTKPAAPARLDVTVEPEPQRWRGPAGLVADVCAGLAPGSQVLVVEGARWYGSSLAGLVADHAASGAWATVARSPDGTPAGAYVLRREALEVVPRSGFLDMKEQFMDRLIRTERRPRVYGLEGVGARGLRTLRDALGVAGSLAGGAPGWKHVSPNADVHPGAVVLSSVVMDGAKVGDGGLVARSVVVPGGVVPAGAEVVDAVVDSRGVHRVQERAEAGAGVRRRG